MAGVNVGTAYLEIVPSAKGFVGKLQSDLGGGMAKAGESAGESYAGGMRGKIGSLAKGVIAPLAMVGAAVGVKDFLSSAFDEARESQKVGAMTAQVIKSTGGAAKVTADQVGDLATALSNKTGIDDETIQSGANMLLTFKNVRNEVGAGNDIFNQSTSILTDMSVAMGTEPKQAAIQLGKALNDPVKGISALSRVGVTFTEQQKKTIKSLVEGGKTADAQKIILKELNSEFGGAAEAQATAGDKMKTTWANFQEAVGTALLPALDSVLTVGAKVVGWMTDNLPSAIDKAKGFFAPLAESVMAMMPRIQSAIQQGFEFIQTNVLPIVRRLADFFVTTLIPAAVTLGETFVANVLPILRRVFAFVQTTLLPNLQRIGQIIITQVVPAVVSFVQGFVANALPAIQKVAGFVSGTLVPGFLKIADAVVKNIMPIVQALVAQFTANVLPALSSLWQTITTKVVPILIRVGQVIAPVVVWLATLVANILGKVIPVLINLAGPIIGGLIKAVGAIVTGIAGFVGKLIDWGIKIGAFAKGVWDAMVGAKDKVVAAWKAIQDKISGVKDWVTGAFATAWAAVKGVVTKPIDDAKKFLETRWDNIKTNFTNAKDWVTGTFSKAWSAVKGVVTAPIDAAKTFLETRWNNIKANFTAVKDWVTGTFSREWAGIKKVLTDPIDAVKTSISNILGATGLQRVFSNAVDAIGRIWGGIAAAVSGPINTVIGFINRTFIGGLNWLLSKIPGVSLRIAAIPTGGSAPVGINKGGGGQARYNKNYATGGVLDGYTPGKDVHQFYSPTGGRLELSGGEAIMRPEWTRAVGSGFVNGMNALARTGGVSAVRQALGFAGGGIWDVGRGILGGLTGMGTPKDLATVGIAAYDTWEKAKAFVVNAFNGLLGGAGNSFAGQAFKGAAGSIKDAVVKMAQDAFGFGGGTPALGAAGSGKPGSGWQWMWNLIHSKFPGAVLTSGFRPGARIAGSGQQSMHALGRAIDIGGAVPQLTQIARWIASNYGSKSADLLYTPAFGNMGIYRGKWYRQPSITTAEHGNHVHWGFKNGGVPVFDQGGTLAPGMNVVQNNLGRPEPLVRADLAPAVYNIHATIDARDLAGLRSLEEFVALFPVTSRQYQGA